MNNKIIVKKASENNLKNIDVEIEHNKITVVTGVSGSGKSSLAYDIICNEAQRRYLSSFSSNARQYLKRVKRPDVEQITGLLPTISVEQKTTNNNPRSTIGTMSELNDFLRLLFARLGKKSNEIEKSIERRLFSFNSQYGACPHCKGLGLEEVIDVNKLIEDKNKTLREGALKITTPSGYTVYSQVTIDVMNQICNAHNFNVDIPWKDLTVEQKKIILYGTDIIKIPFGKHTLESRMKWSGITAKPREEGFYKGIIPVMEEILKRDRNKNILRFVSSQKCSVCKGKRLNKDALSIIYDNKNIADFFEFTIEKLHNYFNSTEFLKQANSIELSIKEAILIRTNFLLKLGLGHLKLSRNSGTLSGGEAQRIRLVNILTSQLRGTLFVLDEPSIGLHPKDNKKLISILQELVNNGNTVLIVEHDEETILNSENIIDIGTYAGVNGGNLIYSGRLDNFLSKNIKNSITHDFLSEKNKIEIPKTRRNTNGKYLTILNASHNNLKKINIEIPLGVLTVVTGVSGAGKSSLIHNVLANTIKNELNSTSKQKTQKHTDIQGINNISKLIEIDQSPIGRTPRSNPATYTKLFDYIRDLFASLPQAKEKKWKKGRFSFNNKGGRCETCQGAGLIQIGMHFMGNVDIVCSTCNGKRFNNETLSVKFNGKNIYEVLEMTVDDACIFFSEQKKIMQYLLTLQKLGLGYITLGQPATTLSGGEAQRIKLAAELSKNAKGHTLYILDEPTTGLHFFDIKILLKSLHSLIDAGNSVIIIEHNTDVIQSADYIIDMGPESGEKGGKIIAKGTPEEIIKNKNSIIGKELKLLQKKSHFKTSKVNKYNKANPIEFKRVSTHNLKNIDVKIPINKLTVITGVSGSGKSSLAFDTIFAEGQKRYAESLSNYLRTFIKQKGDARFDEAKGMTPAIAINQKSKSQNPRSTLGTVTEIYDFYRLLYSRVGKAICPICDNELIKGKCENCNFIGTQILTSSMFSFNNEQGACETCKGLGYSIVCDINKLISNPELSISNGAMKAHKTGKFYGDINGQYIAILNEVGKQNSINFSLPWKDLNADAQHIAMYGTANKTYDVVWKYKRKNREGTHNFSTSWKGFANIINEEFERKHADKRGNDMLPIMKHQQCKSCKGARLNKEASAITFAEISISELSKKSVKESISFFTNLEEKINDKNTLKVIKDLRSEILKRLEILNDIGLSYLTIDRNTNTLSGGEARRMQLAGQIVSGLSGITYVLDEPSIGLHNSDTKKLIQLLQKLRDAGNTVIVVEHDAEIISSADHIIDIGKGAGRDGGKIIAEGNLQKIISSPNSITGKYLKNPIKIVSSKRNFKKGIFIKEAFANNLKNINLDISENAITAITGVSGSGKSSLLFDVIYKSAKEGKAYNCKSISGFEKFNRTIKVDQSLPTKSSSSTLATYIGFYDIIRDIFASQTSAKEQNIKKTHFSFNTKGGRCETCKGTGQIKTSMDFLSDVYSICENCKGKRFKHNILNIRHNNKSIFEILQLTVSEANIFFKENNKLKPYFEILQKTGLGYLTLGQKLNTFSGGELQRIKLSKSLVDKQKGTTLFLLDEPTTGLHFKDVETLINLFKFIIEKGNTIILTEHNQDIIKHSDFIIELDPEGGENGGYLLKNY